MTKRHESNHSVTYLSENIMKLADITMLTEKKEIRKKL